MGHLIKIKVIMVLYAIGQNLWFFWNVLIKFLLFSPISSPLQLNRFCWDRSNFLHSVLYDTMFCICDENSIDNTNILGVSELFLLWVKIFSVSYAVLLMSGDAQEVERRHNLDRWSKLVEGIFHTRWCCEWDRWYIQSYGVWFPK